MGIIVDLIIVLVLALFIFAGYKKGLTGSLIKLVSFVVAIALAFMLYKPIANIIKEKTSLAENIEQTIIQTFGKENVQEENVKEDNIPTSILNNISSEIENQTLETRNEIVQNTAKSMSITIINVASGIIVFLVARIVLFVISLFIKEITKLPIIKQVDKAGGIAYGILEGMIVIYIILGIISLLSFAWTDEVVIMQAIHESTIGEILYNNNIILNILL